MAGPRFKRPMRLFFGFLGFFILILLPFSALTAFADTATSGNDPGLNEILAGFEDNETSKDSKDRHSDEPSNIDAVLDGFDDAFDGMPETPRTNPAGPAPQKIFPADSPFTLDGYFKLSTSYNFAHNPPISSETDWRGLSRLRTELQLDLNVDLPGKWQALVSGKGFYDFAYRINGKDDYTDDVIDGYESELEFREVYLQGTLFKNLDVKVGRQIVVWGKSDNIRVTDVLNPLDMREPAMTDIEDLRLPVTMTRLDYYTGNFNISAMAIHEIRFNKNPEYGHDFFPSPIPLPPENKPDSTLENTEFALAVNGIFSGWDFSAYYADYYNDEFRAEAVSAGGLPGLRLTHDRLQMVGSTANIALGNWLVKGEIAWIHGLGFVSSPGRKFDRVDVLAGFEYSGFSETTITIEAVNRHLNEFTSELAAAPANTAEDRFQSVLRFTRTFVHETVTLTILASLYGLDGDDGSFQRYSAEYDINDFTSVLFGMVTYQSGELAEMENIGKNDRMFIEARYSF